MKPLWRAIEALAWIAFFVFATLVLALRFWLLPDIERYRGDIVAAIERTVGLPIKIAGIEAGWLGLRPQISLSDVHLYDHQGREVLALPSIHNVVSWRSLLVGELRLYSLAIDGPRLEARRAAAGAFRAEPAPAKVWRPPFYRAHGASAAGAWRESRIACPAGRPQRDRSRGLERPPLRPARLHRPRGLAGVDRLPARCARGAGRAARLGDARKRSREGGHGGRGALA